MDLSPRYESGPPQRVWGCRCGISETGQNQLCRNQPQPQKGLVSEQEGGGGQTPKRACNASSDDGSWLAPRKVASQLQKS